ncbi:hypothetical protein AXX16_1140 [Serratia rubidaea]|nr:hypothetical protein AXX16_1140 [Serratia rubidaea]
MVDVFGPFHRGKSHLVRAMLPFPSSGVRIGESWSKLKLKRRFKMLFTQLYTKLPGWSATGGNMRRLCRFVRGKSAPLVPY